ncbi:MAG: hypothetical protein RJB09_421 [Pseudomonadota bacterium]
MSRHGSAWLERRDGANWDVKLFLQSCKRRFRGKAPVFGNSAAGTNKKLCRDTKNTCVGGRNPYVAPCPISHVPVVVCRLAGIRTRGRSLVSKKPAAGANRRTPPNGGRDLKQRRTGLFRLCRPSKGRRTEEACLSCRACGAGAHPFPNDGHHTLVERFSACPG